MTALPFDAFASWVGNRLLIGSLEAIVLVSLVWYACRRGSLSAAMQATLWWLAAAKIVLVMLPLPAVALALLPAPTPIQLTATDGVAGAPAEAKALPVRDAREATRVLSGPRGRPGSTIVISAWLLVVIVHGMRLFAQHRQVRRVVHRSVPCGGDVEPLASAIGLRRIPAVHRSSDIDAPQVVGIVRPVILMPATPMAEADRIMALSHELMHVRRGDLALGWVPAIAERLFFFHPLVRLAGREYQTAREAACDAAVVQALGIRADDYGRLLVRFGVASGQPACTAGGASRSMSSLRRRLAMLQQSSSNGSRRIGWALSAVLLLAMVPIQVVAQAPNRVVRLQPDLKRVAPKPARQLLIDPPVEIVEAPVAQEPQESTAEFLREQLVETQKALRAAQADDAARADLEKRRLVEIESMLQSIGARRDAERAEASREIERAIREATQRARDVDQFSKEANDRARELAERLFDIERARDTEFGRTRDEYAKALEAARLKESAMSQVEFTAQQLDSLRRTIEQMSNQLEEMRKMERRLREELKKK